MATDDILRQWAQLGILFNVKPTGRTPDIEQLLIDTAITIPHIPRLLPACVTWLIHYDRLVCRHRLSAMAAKLSNVEASAALGLICHSAKDFSGTDHFNLVIKKCRPLKIQKPLFEIDRKFDKLFKLSHSNSSSVSRKWGLWCESIQLKEDAIRPLEWLMQHNPSLKQRAVFNGNLRASILEILANDEQAGQSESLLSRHCHATRKAVREALDHLEFCQLVIRRSVGGRILISLR